MTIIFLLVLILFRTGCSEEIITFPENKTATLGSLVEFQCGVKFSATVSALTWEFNGEAVYHYQFDREEYPSNSKIANKFVVRQDGTNFKLTLKNAFFDAAGNYTCRLTRAFATVHLVVIDTPQLIAFVPKNDKEKMALYVCEAKFAGPSKTEIAPGQYPQLRMVFDYIATEEPVCELQPKNSTSYRVLKQAFRATLQPRMDGKQLKCMITTSNPELVASTQIEVSSQESEGVQMQVAASSSSIDAALAFSVINFIILIVIIAVVIYKVYMKKKKDYTNIPGKDPMEAQIAMMEQTFKAEEAERHQEVIKHLIELNETIQTLNKPKEVHSINAATSNSKDQKPSEPLSPSPDSSSDEQSSQLESQDQGKKLDASSEEHDLTGQAEKTAKQGKSDKKKGVPFLLGKLKLGNKTDKNKDKENNRESKEVKSGTSFDKTKKDKEKTKKAKEKAKKPDKKAEKTKNGENIPQSQGPTPELDQQSANAPAIQSQEPDDLLILDEGRPISYA